MADFPRPRVVISRCIEFDHCRWNGVMISSDVVKLLKPHVEFVPVCPEADIGLGVPREPVRLVGLDGEPHLIQPATGLDLTERMHSFAARFLDGLGEVDGFLLKSRSPTCGIKDVRVYPPKEGATPVNQGVGAFTARVQARLPNHVVEDEGRLTNYALREHFLTRIYTAARFRRARAEGTIGALVRFQAEHKLLLMAYSQAEMRVLGRIVAHPERQPLGDLWADYAAHLDRALNRPPRHPAVINVLMHAFGYFDQLSSAEKRFFLICLDDYRAGKLPLSVCTAIIESWIARFQQAYLREQAFFHPYPEDLVQITDSGKGRDF